MKIQSILAGAVFVFLAMGVASVYAKELSAQELFQQANRLFLNYEFESSEQSYLAALKKDSMLQWAHHQLGRIYFSRNELKKALDEFNREIVLHKDSANAFYMRGLTYVFLEDLKRAEQDFRLFLDFSPNSEAGNNDLAQILFIQGKFQDAEQILLRLLGFYPESFLAKQGLGAVYVELGEFTKAKQYIQNTLDEILTMDIPMFMRYYPSLNPKYAEDGIETIRQGISYNLKIAVFGEQDLFEKQQVASKSFAPYFQSALGEQRQGAVFLAASCEADFEHFSGECIPSFPDLIIQSISASPSSPKVGESITYTVVVKNQGEESSSGGWLGGYTFSPSNDCSDGLSSFGYISFGTISAGSQVTKTITKSGGFSPSGSHTVWMFADDFCSVSESSETNNQSSKTVTVSSACNSSSFISCDTDKDFGDGGIQGLMCGADQYYRVTVPSGQVCDIAWAMVPDAGADYDLYVKWSASLDVLDCPILELPASWDCRPFLGAGSSEVCAKTALGAGTYKVLVHKFSGSGSYAISGNVSNCVSVDTTSAAVTINASPTSVTTTWQNTNATASISCFDASGCEFSSNWKWLTRESSISSCSSFALSEYTETYGGPFAITNHVWMCATAKDASPNGNRGYSSPIEFKVDKSDPVVGPISPTTAEVNVAQIFSARVRDIPSGIRFCTLWADGQEIGEMTLSESPCFDCIASRSHTFLAGGTHPMFARCVDNAEQVTTGPGAQVPVPAKRSAVFLDILPWFVQFVQAALINPQDLLNIGTGPVIDVTVTTVTQLPDANFEFDPSSITLGSSTQVRGKLQTNEGTGIGGKTVKLQYWGSDETFHDVDGAFGTTQSLGSIGPVSFSWIPTDFFLGAVSYRLRFEPKEDDNEYLSSSTGFKNLTVSQPTLTFPSGTWQRLWYWVSGASPSFLTSNFLGEGPNQSVEKFTDDWGNNRDIIGPVAENRKDLIGFRSSRSINFPIEGAYRFTITSDDGVRLWIDGSSISLSGDHASWQDKGRGNGIYEGNFGMTVGSHDFILEWYENGGDANISFDYELGAVPEPTGGCTINESISAVCDGVSPPGGFFGFGLGTSFAPEPCEYHEDEENGICFYNPPPGLCEVATSPDQCFALTACVYNSVCTLGAGETCTTQGCGVVECIQDADCTEAGSICDLNTNTCVVECTQDSDCTTAGKNKCDLSTNTCVSVDSELPTSKITRIEDKFTEEPGYRSNFPTIGAYTYFLNAEDGGDKAKQWWIFVEDRDSAGGISLLKDCKISINEDLKTNRSCNGWVGFTVGKPDTNADCTVEDAEQCIVKVWATDKAGNTNAGVGRIIGDTGLPTTTIEENQREYDNFSRHPQGFNVFPFGVDYTPPTAE